MSVIKETAGTPAASVITSARSALRESEFEPTTVSRRAFLTALFGAEQVKIWRLVRKHFFEKNQKNDLRPDLAHS